MTLAEKLLNLRTDRGLSQGDLAEKLDVSRQSVSKWETGQSVPDLDKIIKLADLFGVTVDDLVREEGRPEPSTPQVVYVEKKREPTPDQSLQVMGILCEAVGAAFLVLGLMGMGLFLPVGLVFVILGLPLLLAKKHPFLISGWLLAGLWILAANPWTTAVPVWSVLLPLRAGKFYRITLLPLARDVLLLALVIGTGRAVRKKKNSRDTNP